MQSFNIQAITDFMHIKLIKQTLKTFNQKSERYLNIKEKSLNYNPTHIWLIYYQISENSIKIRTGSEIRS